MSRFAAIVANARRTERWTAAQMDYLLSCNDNRAIAALGNAAYMIANEHHPLPDTTEAVIACRERANKLIDDTTAEREAMIAAAKQKSYVGWSNASRGPIRYAS